MSDIKVQTIRFVTTVGLSQEVLQNYICIHDEESGLFFVNIGQYGIEGFNKSTFINLINLAEAKKAKKIYFIVSRDNKDHKEYRNTFKLIDLKRVSSKEKEAIFKRDNDFLVYSREFS